MLSETFQTSPGISDCPPEVLEHIFSFLPLSDRKSSSLVCTSWNELAFSSRYMRHVVLRLIHWPHSHSILKQSTRSYRNLFAFFGSDQCTEADYNLVVEVLDLFGPTMASFHCMTYFSISQLRRIIERIPNVQQLVVGLVSDGVQSQEEFPVLQNLTDLGSLNNILHFNELNLLTMAPNLSQLSVNVSKRDDPDRSLEVLQNFAPQLKIFDLFSTERFFSIDELHFPQLEVLKLSGEIFSSSEPLQQNFFEKFVGLKEASLNCGITSAALQSFTKSCSALQSLELKLDSLGRRSLLCLQQLKHVKTLKLIGSLRIEMFVDCIPLSSVDQLKLYLHDTDNDKAACKFLREMLPNIREIKVVLRDRSHLDGFLTQLFQNFTQLKQLSISDRGICPSRFSLSSVEALDQLMAFEMLEELTLKSVSLSTAYLLPSKSLKRLKLDFLHHMSDDHILKLSEKYPQLRYLEVNWCRQVTVEAIRLLRARIPNCVVHYPLA